MNEATQEVSRVQKDDKKKRPGLNVVTNFSKSAGRSFTDGVPSQQAAQRQLEYAHTDRPVRSHSDERVVGNRPQQPNGAPAFVSLDDLKDLASKSKQSKDARTGSKEKPTDGHGRFLSPDQRKAVGGEMSSSKVHELSPSDGPIMIGITIPSQDLLASHASHETQNQSAKSEGTPATPSIVITPAKEDGPWSTLEHEERARRPASSIYSQATPYVGAIVDSQVVPPVPAIPRKHAYDKSSYERDRSGPLGVSSGGSGMSQRKERGLSTDTLFEEDESPQVITRARSDSNESQQGILDTTTARPQSRGWWNLMLSPMLTRSNTLASKKSPTLDTDQPQVPSLAKAAQIAGEHKGQYENLDKPRSKDQGRGESIWNDMGEWEQKRRDVETTPNEPTQDSQHKTQDSSGTIQFMIGSPAKEGSAAEYFQACAHDLVNPIPFFQCENHSCALESIPHRTVDVHTVANEGPGSPRVVSDTAKDKDVAAETNGKTSNNPFFQTPSNRFSAAFRQAANNRTRPDSVSTVIEDEPELSPNVREANVAPILRAKPVAGPTPAPQTSKDSPSTKVETSKETPSIPPPYSPGNRITRFPKYVAIMPPERQPPVQDAVQSPGPLSPGGQEAMSSRGAIPMSEMPTSQPPQAHTIHNHYYAGGLPPRPKLAPVTFANIEPQQAARQDNEARRQRLEKEDAAAKKVGGLWRGRGCISNRGCFGRGGPEGRKRRRWYIAIASGLVAMIILAVVLAMTLTRRGDGTPVQSQWLNLTGFPPMPTGISTIAQPDVQSANTGCVHPTTMWSCALPKEQQQSVAPNDPDQPNFRFEIRFRNGTLSNVNGTSPNTVQASRRAKRSGLSARGLIRHKILQARDAFTDSLFTPSPAPPNLEDQNFLGKTTDNVTAPFAGEETPFFITFLPTTPVTPNRLAKRQNSTETNATVPDITDAIPPPDTNPDGTAAAANLLPFPSSQPIRLYNRGESTEHYGFYTYYDRSIFLKSTALLNGTDPGEVPDDENGGALESAASVRCTWAQTRFLVQIWTRPGSNSMALLQNSNSTLSQSSPTSSSSESTPTATNPATNSAIDFDRPGSFPYPVTITLDRHGGDIAKKMVYCYGMDDRERIIPSEKKFQMEFRDFGGQLVNPALGPFTNVNVSLANGGPGGIDGGTGGCDCQWVNWAGTE
jgi:hypothetical protein